MYRDRKAALLAFVQGCLAENGELPSLAAIARALGCSKSTCQRDLQRLRREVELPRRGRAREGTLPERLLQAIAAYTQRHGCAPSIRNLAAETGLAPATVLLYLRRLADEGKISYRPSTARSVRVIHDLED